MAYHGSDSSAPAPETVEVAASPQHVAIIMDGNGRWAAARGLERIAGHRAGEHALFDVVDGALELRIAFLTVFAFSTENWSRDPDEVLEVLELIRGLAVGRREELVEKNISVRWVGSCTGRMPASVIAELEKTQRATSGNSQLVFTICVDYGGRSEIVEAARRIVSDVLRGTLVPNEVNELTYARYLSAGVPDVDLLIRTSGEQRLSNFLLWQTAYAEFLFCPKLWPDFSRTDLAEAITVFNSKRRQIEI